MTLTAALALAGCAGLGDGLLASQTTGGVQPAAVADAITSDTDVSAMPRPKAEFNPFRDAASAVEGGREVIAHPTLAEVLKPGPLPEIVLGRPDAPVTIVKYMSLTCPYCRQFQATTFPQLKRELIDTGQVRFILREFPIGFQSGLATVAMRCAAPERQLALYEKFLARQAQWASQEVRPEPIARIAAEAGVTADRFAACRQDATLIAGLKAVKERGRTLGIVGTPNFFVNERLVKSVLTLEQIRALVAERIAAR